MGYRDACRNVMSDIFTSFTLAIFSLESLRNSVVYHALKIFAAKRVLVEMLSTRTKNVVL